MGKTKDDEIIRLSLIDDANSIKKEETDSVDIERQNLIYDSGIREQKLEQEKIKTENLRKDSDGRASFSIRIFWLLVGFLAITLFIVCLCGRGCMVLDASVLIALLSTSCANVIGLFAIVMNYLFRKPKE